jgi:predicted O-methyltransferase YrrM
MAAKTRQLARRITFQEKISREVEERTQSAVRDRLLSGDAVEAMRLAGPSRAKIFRDLGSEFLSAGNEELSLTCRRAAVELTPADQTVHIELLRTLVQLGKWEDALAQAVKLDLSYPSVPRHDMTAEEKVIYSVVVGIAIASPELIANLVRAVDYVVRQKIPGAFVECGVFRGGSALAMMLALRARGFMERDFFLYDTYAGMPVPEDIDAYSTGRPAREEWEEKKRPDGSSGWVVSTLDETRAVIETAGYPRDKTHYVQGLVEDTIPREVPDRISLLRLDTDFYRSTKHELEHLFPRLSQGGVLLIDDYGAFRGSQIAVDEYFAGQGLRPYLHRVDANVRIVIKE